MNLVTFIRITFIFVAYACLNMKAFADNEGLIIKKVMEPEVSTAASSCWKFSEDFNTLIDSYSSFIFRTKKSRGMEQINFVIEVNSVGKIVGFELVSEVDKGLTQRLDYVVRQLPDCLPVVGVGSYKAEKFEVILKK